MSNEETNLKNENNEKTKNNNNNEEEENQGPIHKDCFEYVLTGVTVHSGSENTSHYWCLFSKERDV